MFEALRRLLDQLLGLIEGRLELLSADVAAEIRRYVRALVWVLTALIFAALGLLMAALTVVITLWEHDRLVASLWVMGGFLAAAAFAAFKVWRTLMKEPGLFYRTIDSLRRDRESLK